MRPRMNSFQVRLSSAKYAYSIDIVGETWKVNVKRKNQLVRALI